MTLLNDIKVCRPTLPAFAVMGILWGGFAAFVPAIKSSLNAGDGLFGFVLLFVAFGAVSAMWFAPLFSERFGRHAMALGAVMYIVAMQAVGFASTVATFTMIGFFVGASAGTLDVTVNARLSEIEARHNTSAMNLNHGVYSLGFGVAALTAGMARQAGYDIGSFMLAAGAVSLVLVPFMVQSRVKPGEEPERSDAKLSKAVIWGGLIVLIGFLCENATEGWSALHIERSLGGEPSEGALGPASLGFMMAFGRFGGQALVTRLSEAVVLQWAAVMAGIGALMAAFAVSPVMAYFGFGALGLGVSVVAPMVFALVGRRTPNALRPRAISRVAVIGYFGFFAGPPIMGMLSEIASLRVSFAFLAVLLLAVPALLVLLRRT